MLAFLILSALVLGAEPTVETTPATPPASAQEVPTYETVFVEGRRYLVGKAEGLVVWFSLTSGSDLAAQIMVVNETTEPITFDPRQITAQARSTNRQDKVVSSDMHTYSAEEYQSRANSDAAARRALGAVTRGLGAAARELGAAARELGAAAREPADQMLGEVIDEADARRQNEAIQAHVELATRGLMRVHTLFPGKSYYGAVHFKKQKAQFWAFDLPFGGTVFEFTYSGSK